MRIKTILVVAAAALLCVPATAQKKSKKAAKAKTTAKAPTLATPEDLKPVDGQTFSYALGVAQGSSLKQYLIQREGVDSAYVQYAVEGMNAQISDSERKQKEAYAAGLRIADMNKRNLAAFNRQATGKEDSAYVNIAEFQRGLAEEVMGHSTTLTRDSAMKVVEQQIKYQQEVYKSLNKKFLVDNAKLKGVKTLPSGLQYQVLTEGTGAVATDSSEVEVHYEGALIDGTVFDSSYKRGKPATFRPNQVIKGWKEALTMMPEGSVWNLYIPSELGYGERGSGQSIPGNSTLVFKVEVIKVKAAEAKSAKK